MSVEELAAGLDSASEKLALPELQHAHGLLEEATEALYAVASETNDQELAEVFGQWQQAAAEIARAFQVCGTVRDRITSYRTELVGSSGSSRNTPSGKESPTAEPASKAIIDPNKFKYFFGRVKSDEHNENRSNQNIDELSKIRIFDTPDGQGTLRRHLESVVSTDENIKRTFSNKFGEYQIRDSLLTGPGGFLQLETTWHVTDQGLRLTTMIPKRGKK